MARARFGRRQAGVHRNGGDGVDAVDAVRPARGDEAGEGEERSEQGRVRDGDGIEGVIWEEEV